MADESQILKNELEAIKQDLIAKHLQLGMKASGQWINSLNVEVSGLSGVISNAPYTEQLVSGRPSGKFPPVSAIEQWIIDKNIRCLFNNDLVFL